MRYLSLFILLFWAQSAHARECVKVSLFVGEKAKLKNIEAHPCGGTVSLCLKKIPKKFYKMQDKAYELSSEGKVIKKWPLVADAQVRGIVGSKVIVAYPNDSKKYENGWVEPYFIRISPSGRIKKHRKVLPEPSNYFRCSEVTQDERFVGDFCFKLKDLKTKKVRIMYSPPVCS